MDVRILQDLLIGCAGRIILIELLGTQKVVLAHMALIEEPEVAHDDQSKDRDHLLQFELTLLEEPENAPGQGGKSDRAGGALGQNRFSVGDQLIDIKPLLCKLGVAHALEGQEGR